MTDSPRLVDRLRSEPPEPGEGRVAFGGGVVRWTQTELVIEHDSAGRHRLVAGAPMPTILVSRSQSESRRWWRRRVVHQVHAVLRSSGQTLLVLRASSDEAALEGLPALDERGAEVTLAELLAVVGAARALGASVAHLGALDDRRPAQTPIAPPAPPDPPPAPPSEATTRPENAGAGTSRWHRLRERIAAMDSGHWFFYVLLPLILVLAGAWFLWERSKKGDPIGEIQTCESAHADSVGPPLWVARPEGEFAVVTEQLVVENDFYDPDYTDNKVTRPTACLRVSRYAVADGELLERRTLHRRPGRTPLSGTVVRREGDRIWLSVDGGLEILDLESLEVVATLESMLAEVPELAALPPRPLQTQRIRLLEDGWLGVENDLGQWFAVSPDQAMRSAEGLGPVGRETSFDQRTCSFVAHSSRTQLYDATDSSVHWSLVPEHGVIERRRVLQFPGGELAWREALIEPTVAVLAEQNFCADFGLADAVLVTHGAKLDAGVSDMRLSLVGLDGAIRWTKPLTFSRLHPVTVTDALIIVLTVTRLRSTSDDLRHELLGLDRQNGVVRYRRRL